MKLREILFVTMNDTPVMKEKSIHDSYQLIKKGLMEAEQAEEDMKNKRQKQFLKIYINVLDKINSQLQIAKQKYRNLNKQKLKEERCLKLAKDIKLFRQQCYHLRDKLAKSKKELEEEKAKDFVTSCQKMGYKTSIAKAKSKKTIEKRSYTQFKSYLDDDIRPQSSKGFTRNRVDNYMELLQNPRPKTTGFNMQHIRIPEQKKRNIYMETRKHNYRKNSKSFKETNNTISM